MSSFVSLSFESLRRPAPKPPAPRLPGTAGSRFFSQPGRSVVERPDATPLRGYYAGVATLSQAEPVDVSAGEQHSSVDFTIVQHRQPPAMMRASFISADGKPIFATSTLASLDDAIGGTAISSGGISDNMAQRIDPGVWLFVARGFYAPGVALVPIPVGFDFSDLHPLVCAVRLVSA
jgi:hypothetical protein